MSVPAADLETLHRLHRQRTDLRSRLDRGPRQIRACEENLARTNEALETAKAVAQRARMTADEKQLQLKSNESRIADLEGKRNSCNTNKEYQTLVEQIAAAEMANSVLADEILEMLEKYDELEKTVSLSQENVQKVAADLAKIKERIHSQHDHLAEEVGRVEADLARLEVKLPADFRIEYDRVVKAKGEDGLARLEGESCGSCFQVFTPQNVAELYLGKTFFCRGCGSIVYKSEDSSVGNPG